MFKILLPTIDYEPNTGGVARYLSAMKKTFPENVEVLFWETYPGHVAAMKELFAKRAQYKQIWTSHLLPIGTLCWLLWILSRTPYVVFLHGMDFDLARRNRWKRWLSKRILRSAHRVVVNSDALGREVATFVNIQPPLTVYPCISDEMLAAAQHSEEKGHHRVRLLTVSRLVSRKGHEAVLQALVHLPDVDYWIVGGGEYRNDLEKMVQELRLQKRVKFFGEVTHEGLVRAYQEADIFVMPTKTTSTDREGFGIVYLEAQAFGLPVIASDIPGVNEAILDGKTGILVKDQIQLEESIRFFAQKEDARKRFGDAGQRHVGVQFTREKQCEKLRELM